MATTLLQPGQIEAAASAIPELRLPGTHLFAARARRFQQLARTSSLGDWLELLARLSEAQQQAFDALPPLTLPSNELLERCRLHAMPPLAPAGWSREAVWQDVLRSLLTALDGQGLPPLQATLRELRLLTAHELEGLAEQVLKLRVCAPGDALLVGAALQVYWTALAGALNVAEVARPEQAGLCPVCGSPPTSSVIRIGGAENGLRYLHCSLCSSEWHVVRAKCSHCENSQGLAYYSLEGAQPAVRAEACPHCHSYLKVLDQERDPSLDPLADDLASLALDILVGEEGFERGAVNRLLAMGEG